MKKKLYFATKNKFKFQEAKRILKNLKLKQAKIEVGEIQSQNLEEIAEKKALASFKILKKPLIVEDTALHLKCLNNFPGAAIKLMVKTIKPEGICDLVSKYKNKEATAESCFAFFDGKKMKIFSGEIKGAISGKPRGRNRFDWDRIFIPQGFQKTFAELPLETKNRVSHRSRALRKLEKWLSGTLKFRIA